MLLAAQWQAVINDDLEWLLGATHHHSICFHIPTRLMTMAGLEPLPDASRLTIAPVRLPCDFQSASVGAATPSLLIIIMRVDSVFPECQPLKLGRSGRRPLLVGTPR
jgi:hypothetical protein